LKGILTHTGQTYACKDVEKIRQTFRKSADIMLQVKAGLATHGIQDIQVSMGDTPGCTLAEDFSGVDEIRPGNFVFNDLMQFSSNVCAFEDVAVVVGCPVVAVHPERGQAILYGGAVHLSKETLELDSIRNYGWVSKPEGSGWGTPLEGVYVERLTQEHGVVRLSAVQLRHIRVGDLLYVIPVHSCLTIDLFDDYLNLDGRKYLIKK
jgi:D-serine deaminase-like pyridoxal phosphate-dependent protein